jgi:predicted nucleic acid-binding Zn ribbon protein
MEEMRALLAATAELEKYPVPADVASMEQTAKHLGKLTRIAEVEIKQSCSLESWRERKLWKHCLPAGQRTFTDRPATATITRRPRGSIVEARGNKVLPISAQSRAWWAQGRGLEVAEMSKEYANERNRSWSVRHDS